MAINSHKILCSRDIAACALPVMLIAWLCLTYIFAPDFYLRYVLELHIREYQMVEMITAISAFVSSILLLIASVRLWRLRPLIVEKYVVQDGPAWLGGRWAALHVAILAAAMLFFAGEEVNYGQFYINRNNKGLPRHLNLHNMDLPISIQSLGSVFLVVMFLVVPLIWWQRKRWHLPAEWEVAIPQWPVVFFFAITMIWSKFKHVYAAMLDGNPKDHQIYREFFEQINEQKEMLIAVMVLVYALYCLDAVKTLAGPASKMSHTQAGDRTGHA